MLRLRFGTALVIFLDALMLGILQAGESPKSERPNVIIIISDDQGWADIGYNNQKVYTPHLDQLASTSAVFKNHYVMPQCTPTRVAAMTGRYPGRFGPHAVIATNVPAFPIGTPTLGSMFKEVGYETYLCGKWHLGPSAEHGPLKFGFDHSYGCFSGAVGMYDHRYRDGEFGATWHRDDQLIEGSENGVHATDLVAKEAVSVIERKRESPFFLYLAFNAVHTPLDERGDFVDQPTKLDPAKPGRWLNEDKIKWFNDPDGKIQAEPDPEKRLFLAAAYHMDHAIGEVVAALERSGQRKNTLILFSSDNGPQVNWPGNAYPNDLKLTDFNQTLPMRGHKIDVWEGGIHVPAFANWPEHITPGVISDTVHIIDWFPTLAKLIDYHPKIPIPWDGVELSKLVFDHQPLGERDLYWLWGNAPDRWALRLGDWKIVNYGKKEPSAPDAWQLYHLSEDPKEQNDVASKYPERVSNMHQRFLIQRGKDLKKDP